MVLARSAKLWSENTTYILSLEIHLCHCVNRACDQNLVDRAKTKPDKIGCLCPMGFTMRMQISDISLFLFRISN